MLDREFDSFIEVEAALEEAAEYKLVYDSDSNWYHTNHLWKEFEEYVHQELDNYSNDNLEYHLNNYKYTSNKEDKAISRIILIYYRDIYMSTKDKLILPIELLFAKA